MRRASLLGAVAAALACMASLAWAGPAPDFSLTLPEGWRLVASGKS